ncbi:sugar ABC transporter ATP-binding protein [Jiella sonneratiae]|uniref:Sugar ABC transporter ATP-binding protein n=1 Tax=Jiella sonneratiae TaxID=2816856 RepID=A0ABS3IZM8_9HYPH|nr:sugar ABC transporter ATP-binding protein [Jiella sonneratiae]MBO0902870.1 sugar ABC transporter ATP-binding protein [Jiella sonneratiae]
MRPGTDKAPLEEGRPLLDARGISKSFGGVHALEAADFSCRAGEIHALLGANGAGKSTLVKVLSGVQRPDAGTITLAGETVQFSGPAEAAHHGVATVFQELSLFPHLTVAENIYVGHEPTGPLGQIDQRRMRSDVRALFDSLGVGHIAPGAHVSDLSLADRQLVEIFKALSKEPKLLILDEGTSALGRKEVQRLFDLLRKLKAAGTSVIFISHRMSEIREFVDRMTIFRNGRHVATVAAREASDAEIVEMMLGQRVERSFPERTEVSRDEPPLLELSGFSVGSDLADVSLSLRRGEVLGLAGLEGQGQGTLLLALFGAYRGVAGEALIDGRPVRLSSPKAAMESGIALIPEDRKTEGLVLPMSVRENITFSVLSRLGRFGFVSAARERAFVGRMMERLSVKAASMELPARSLSGGNQQKLVLAKWLETGADVFLFYDPTRGIDVGTKQAFYELIVGLTREGKGVILYSTETSELIGLCHRVAVMDGGRVALTLEGGNITEEEILAASLGVGRGRNAAGADMAEAAQ